MNLEAAMRESPIVITGTDAARLRALLESRTRTERDLRHLERLDQELERAQVVDAADVPRGVVTLYSRVGVLDLDNGERLDITLVLPAEADLSQGRVSVLAPLGTALVGYREGDTIEWDMPGGRRRLRVEEVGPAERL